MPHIVVSLSCQHPWGSQQFLASFTLAQELFLKEEFPLSCQCGPSKIAVLLVSWRELFLAESHVSSTPSSSLTSAGVWCHMVLQLGFHSLCITWNLLFRQGPTPLAEKHCGFFDQSMTPDVLTVTGSRSTSGLSHTHTHSHSAMCLSVHLQQNPSQLTLMTKPALDSCVSSVQKALLTSHSFTHVSCTLRTHKSLLLQVHLHTGTVGCIVLPISGLSVDERYSGRCPPSGTTSGVI